MTDIEFLNKIKPMILADCRTKNILPSLCGAQAFIESSKGNSGLTKKANNLFGIKGSYNGQYVIMPTKEFSGGRYITINSKFRKYSSWKESIEDHSNLLVKNARYKNLIGCTNYRTACRLIQLDGYAKEPKYSEILIKTIERYDINNWDKELEVGNPYKIPTSNIKKGMKGSVVKWVQYELIENGYDLKIDGIFGEKTDACVRKFQFKNGLVTDGIVGKLTRQKLMEV